MTKCPHCHEEFTKRLVGRHVKDCKALRKPQSTQKQQVLSPELVEFMKETLTEIRYLKTEIAELHLYRKRSESQINVQKNEIAKLKMELSQKDETIQQLTVILRSTQDDVQNLKEALSRKQSEHELLTETVLSHQIDMKNIQAQCEKHHEVIKQMTSDTQENNCWRTCCQQLSSQAQQIKSTTTKSKRTHSTTLECSERTALPAMQIKQSQLAGKHERKDYSRGPPTPLYDCDMFGIDDGPSASKPQVLRSSGQLSSYVVETAYEQVLRRNYREHLELFPPDATREPFRLSGPHYNHEDSFLACATPPWPRYDRVVPRNPTSTASIAPSSQSPVTLRRSTRQRRPPRRLMYDQNFQQVP
ncbi:uncharacterized protein LOC144104303 [Amblyomma americanum]